MAEIDPNAVVTPTETIPPTAQVTPSESDLAMMELLKAQSEQIEELNKQILAQTEANKPAPDPSSDPEMAQPENWKQVREEMNARAAKVTQETIERIERERKEAIEAEENKRKEFDKLFDEQVSAAEKEGYLSPVKDPNDPNDVGAVERKELFAIAARLGTPNLKDVAQAMRQMHDKGLHYDYQSGQYVDRFAKQPIRPDVNAFTGEPIKQESGFSAPPVTGIPAAPVIQRSINTPPPTAPVGSSSASGNTDSGRIKVSPQDMKSMSLDQLLRKYNR